MRVFSATTFGGILAISSLCFVACMGTNQDANQNENHNLSGKDLPQGGLGYVVGLTKKAATEVSLASNSSAAVAPGDEMASAKAALQAAGVCQGLISVIDELERYTQAALTSMDSASLFNFNGYPNLQRMLTCTVPWVDKALKETDDFSTIAPTQEDLMSLSDCICGGSGSIFGIYAGVVNTRWQGFSPVQTTGTGFSPVTSGSGFNASGAQTIGNGFAPSTTPMGEGYSPVTP